MVYIPNENCYSSHMIIGSTIINVATEETFGYFGSGYASGYITNNSIIQGITSPTYTELAMLPRFGIYFL